MAKQKKKTIEELEAELQAAKEELLKARREQARAKAAAKRAGVKTSKQPKTSAKKAGTKTASNQSSKNSASGNANSSKVALLNSKGRKMTGPAAIKVSKSAGPDYTLMKEIKESPMYGKTNRDPFARQVIDDNCQKVPRTKIVPGQLVLFEYFDPKTKDKLEYYDASPCTIFFGVFKSKQGKRILGFNIHYYPPKIRYAVMDKIFKIYKPIYTKYFKTGTTKTIDAFDYAYLVGALKKVDLDFGIREYIPQLIGNTWLIPPNQWQVAVFTEGWFKKQTRAAIMKFWKKRMSKP